MGYFSYLSPIMVEDIKSHSDYVNELIAMYSDLIDEYQFDSINWEMLTSAKRKDELDKLLHDYNNNSSNPIPAVNRFGRAVNDSCFTAWRYLIQAIMSLDDDPSLIIENYNNNAKFGHGYPFAYALIDHCGLITVQRTVPKLFSYITFDCDVHIKAEVLGKDSLSHSNLAGHKLVIEEGCKTIEADAISEISAKAIYLPSTIEVLNYNCWYTWALEELPTVHYNGTIQQFTNLMKKSRWKNVRANSKPSSYPLVSADIICTDGKIPMSSKLDRNYNVV